MNSGAVAVGMIVRLVRGGEIAAIARTAGYDSIYMDLEHNSFSLETVGQICMTSAALGVTPLVRVAGLDPAVIGRVLECGALGVIAPHVETAAQAESVVAAAKYPPVGERSFVAALPHTLFRAGPAVETMRKMNDATMVVVMIESAAALDAVEEIASVDGLDMLLVGTNDLCNSLGVPGELEHPKVRVAFERVAAACRKNGTHLGAGGLVSRPDLAKEIIALGARYVSAGNDIGFLMSAALAAAKTFR